MIFRMTYAGIGPTDIVAFGSPMGVKTLGFRVLLVLAGSCNETKISEEANYAGQDDRWQHGFVAGRDCGGCDVA